MYFPNFLAQVVEKLYQRLLLIGEKFGDLHSWPLIIWLSNLCLHCVSGLYFLMSLAINAVSGKGNTSLEAALCLFIWIVAFLAQIILLQFSCEFTAHQVRQSVIEPQVV